MFDVDQRRIIDKNFDQHKRNMMKSILAVATTDNLIVKKKINCKGLEY